MAFGPLFACLRWAEDPGPREAAFRFLNVHLVYFFCRAGKHRSSACAMIAWTIAGILDFRIRPILPQRPCNALQDWDPRCSTCLS